MTCLDSFLFLESEYHFIDALLSLQADCNMADSSDVETLAPPQDTPTFLLEISINFTNSAILMSYTIYFSAPPPPNLCPSLRDVTNFSLCSDLFIIDACSMERNRLLVSCYFTGGPSERCLPPHYFTEVISEVNHRDFSIYPLSPFLSLSLSLSLFSLSLSLSLPLSLSLSLPLSLPPRLVKTTRGLCFLATLLLLSTNSLDHCLVQRRPLVVSFS